MEYLRKSFKTCLIIQLINIRNNILTRKLHLFFNQTLLAHSLNVFNTFFSQETSSLQMQCFLNLYTLVNEHLSQDDSA